MIRFVCILLLGISASFAKEAPIRDNMEMSAREKRVAVRPLLEATTDCIVRAVEDSFDPTDPDTLSDRIVDSIPRCLLYVHALMEKVDALYGDGSGQEYFMGPYLQTLPTVLQSKFAQRQ